VQHLTSALQSTSWEALETATGQSRAQWVEAANILAKAKVESIGL